MNIYQKLAAIQQALKAPKAQFNSFGKYYYRSCEDIVEAVKPLCNEHKALLQLTDDVREVGDKVYVMATARLIDLEQDGSIESYGFAREADTKAGMDAAQITGSCSSYARKYALNGLFCIDDGKDADSLPPVDDGKDADKKNDKKAEKVTAKQVADLQTLAKQKGVSIESIVNGYKLKTLQDISPMQWAQAMNGLKKRADVS